MISSFFAGVAGALFAHSEGYVHTNSFSFLRSFEIVVIVVLGGLGSLTGAILAAAVLTAAPEVLRGLGEWRMILYSVLLIVMMCCVRRVSSARASSARDGCAGGRGTRVPRLEIGPTNEAVRAPA